MNGFTHSIVGLVVGYWIATASLLFGLGFWPPQPAIDRVEAADPTPVSRALIGFFEHTPRIEAVLRLESEAGYPQARLDRDRARYGFEELMDVLAMIVDLLLVAAVAGMATRRGEFDAPAVVAKPRSSLRVSALQLTLTMGGMAAGILALFYFGGVLLHTRTGRPTDNAPAFVWSAHLILVVLIISIISMRSSQRNTGPVARPGEHA